VRRDNQMLRALAPGILAAITLLILLAWIRLAKATEKSRPQTVTNITAGEDKQARDAATLERMARANFRDLTAAEIRLVRGSPYRNLVWSGSSSDPGDPSNDVSRAAAWGRDRTIRERLICWLLTDAEASRLVHPSGVGIAGARITGKIDLSYETVKLPLTIVQSVVSEGLDLSYARIGTIDLRGSLTGPINADQTVVHGDLSLRYGRNADVSLFRAQIDGDLDCRGARLIGDDPLSAVEVRIRGDALFHDGFETDGTLDFRLADIGRSLSFNDARFIGARQNGLNAERATIGGTLYWVNIKLSAHTQLDLGDAHVGSLWDDEASWPSAGNLFLVGFVYRDFAGGPIDAQSRLEWIHRQPKSLWIQPQPYRHLARVMHESGSDVSASDVEIARENAMTRYGDLGAFERMWKLALWATIGYGYRPLWALCWILLFVAIGTIFFAWGYRTRLITPTEPDAYETFVTTGEPPPHYPPFSSFIYSLENFLPVVDLHQGTYWRPNPRRTPEPNPGLLSVGAKPSTIPATLLRWYLWAHILAGWTITPLLFAGLSGLLRND
jgi:hypothetical protein